MKSWFELQHILTLEQVQRTRLSVAIIAGIIGFLLVTQLGAGNQARSEQLSRVNPQELGQIIANLTAEKDILQKEATRLSLRLLQYRQLEANQKLIVNEAAKRLEMMKVVSGLTAVVGPGLVVKIKDPERGIAYYDLVDIINELRAAGAEAISVDGVRVRAETRVTPGDSHIRVDGEKVTAPYVVEAIGNPATLQQALAMPGGFKDALASLPGVGITVSAAKQVVLPAAEGKDLKWGRPVD